MQSSAHSPRSGRPRRLLFVSSTTVGGSGRSQRELARGLATVGWDTRLLVDDGAPSTVTRRMLEELTDATVRFGGRPVGRVLDDVRARIGSRPSRATRDGVVHHTTIAPENAISGLLDDFRPDAVVASSISRVTWRAVRTDCRRRRVPTVLYLREATAIGHLTAGLTADLLIANSGSLVSAASRHGVQAQLVPSVVSAEPAPTPPTSEVALLVNPIATHGLDVVAPLAAARPDIPIVLQESWPLDPREQAAVDRLVADHTNVTFRAYEPDATRIFRDARLLLVPHRIDNRPRTVLEAQVNGIPAVAADQPGIVEAVGEGGVIVDRAAAGDVWVAPVESVWDHPDRIEALSVAARRHASRPEVRPEVVVDRFVELVDDLIGARNRGVTSRD